MKLWRFDETDLNIEIVEFEEGRLPPVEYWMTSMIGSDYIYLSTEESAIDYLKQAIRYRIKNLQDRLESLGN